MTNALWHEAAWHNTRKPVKIGDWREDSSGQVVQNEAIAVKETILYKVLWSF